MIDRESFRENGTENNGWPACIVERKSFREVKDGLDVDVGEDEDPIIYHERESFRERKMIFNPKLHFSPCWL